MLPVQKYINVTRQRKSELVMIRAGDAGWKFLWFTETRDPANEIALEIATWH